GTSHVDLGLPCQDAHCCAVLHDADGAPILVAAAADGAGTAQNAERGAQLATDAFRKRADLFLRERTIGELTTERLKDIVRDVRRALEEAAESEGKPLRSFACTLLAVVIGSDQACFCQIGDGAIIVAD